MKYINIPLVVLLVMSLSFNINAADLSDVTNNTSAVYSFEFVTISSGNSPLYTVYSNELTGTMGYWSIESPYLYDELGSINMYITLANESDMYLALTYPYDSSYFPFDIMYGNQLTQYYAADDSFEAGADVYFGSIVFDTVTYMGTASDSGSIYYNGTVYYIKFANLPAGTYLVNFPKSYWLTPPDGSLTPSVTFGCFVEDHTVGESYFDSWFDPDAPLVDQIGSITDTLPDAIASTTLRDLMIFYTVYAGFQLEQVKMESDLSNVENAAQFQYDLETVITNYNTGTVDYVTALNQMSSEYVDQIAKAETPEQGQYITSMYQVKQQALHQFALKHASDRLESAISDEELEEAAAFYESEDELLAQFNIQQLEDFVDYQEWFNLMSSGDAVTYKSIFDWFFNDASFKFWCVVPITFMIVSILLGTKLRVGGDKSSGSSRNFNSDSDGRVWRDP